MTVLAPTESAMIGQQNNLQEKDIKYHIIEGEIMKKDIVNDLKKNALSKQGLRFNIRDRKEPNGQKTVSLSV